MHDVGECAKNGTGVGGVAMIFAVHRRWSGPWDFSKPIDGQTAWREHADFMDRHYEADTFVLAGPLAGGPNVLIIVRAETADEVEHLLARDPWSSMGMLETISIQPWEIRLGALDQRSQKAP